MRENSERVRKAKNHWEIQFVWEPHDGLRRNWSRVSVCAHSLSWFSFHFSLRCLSPHFYKLRQCVVRCLTGFCSSPEPPAGGSKKEIRGLSSGLWFCWSGYLKWLIFIFPPPCCVFLFCMACRSKRPGFSKPPGEEETGLHQWAAAVRGEICGRLADSAGGNTHTHPVEMISQPSTVTMLWES